MINLSFSPTGESLVVLCDDNTFHVWDVDLQKFSKWWEPLENHQENSNAEEMHGTNTGGDALSLIDATRQHIPDMLRSRMDIPKGGKYSSEESVHRVYGKHCS